MTRLRNWITYGNVTATIAVFLAMSGVAAAVTLAPKNSVTSASIKDGEVKTPDVRGGAVTGAKIAANSVGSGKVIDGSLTGADVRDDSLDQNKLMAASVGTPELADISVVGSKIQAGAVDSRALADNAVGANDAKDLVTATSLGTVIGAGGAGNATVTCPNGGMVIGGGFAWQEEEPNSIVYSTPSENDP